MSDTRDAQAVRPWPVEVVVVPPHPRRPAGPYCPTCGTHTGHWAGCPNTETEGNS